MKGHHFIFLFAAIVLIPQQGCLPDGSAKIEFNMTPEDIGDGWVISTPQAEGINRATLKMAYERFFSESEYLTAISLLVIRHGKLVAEGYCRDLEDRYTKEQINSETKSIASLVFGIAMSLGYFESLDETLYSIMPHAFGEGDGDDRKKRLITLRHLLTMRSGIDFNNRDFDLELAIDAPKNQAKYILSKPLFADPGEKFLYRDTDPQLLGSAVRARTKMSLKEIAARHIFEPLGISDYYWQSNVDGESFAGWGLNLRSRDRGKIGQLVLDRGRFNGQQLIPEAWIDESTSFQTEGDTLGDEWPREEFDSGFTYGYFWWIAPESMNAFFANGKGGEFTFIAPERDLVIIYSAEPGGDVAITGTTFFEFMELAQTIIDAIE